MLHHDIVGCYESWLLRYKSFLDLGASNGEEVLIRGLYRWDELCYVSCLDRWHEQW